MLTEQVKNSLHELSHSQLADIGLHEEEYRRRINQRAEMRKALKGCVSGSISDKTYVKNLIADLLTRNIGLNKTNVDEVILLRNPICYPFKTSLKLSFTCTDSSSASMPCHA